MQHVHPQLVRSPRLRLQPQTRTPCGHSILIRCWAVAGQAGFAALQVYLLQRSMFPIAYQWGIDVLPTIALRKFRYMAMNHCDVALVHVALCKSIAECFLHRFRACKYQQSGRCHVQSMNNQGIGPVKQCTVNQAVLFIFASTRDRKQSGRLIQNQQVLVLVEAGRARGS